MKVLTSHPRSAEHPIIPVQQQQQLPQPWQHRPLHEEHGLPHEQWLQPALLPWLHSAQLGPLPPWQQHEHQRLQCAPEPLTAPLWPRPCQPQWPCEAWHLWGAQPQRGAALPLQRRLRAEPGRCEPGEKDAWLEEPWARSEEAWLGAWPREWRSLS